MIPLLVAPLRLCLYAICQEVSKEVRVDKSEEDSRQSAMPFELNIPEYSSYEFCTPLPGLCGRPWVKKENIYILKQFETLDDILDSWSGWELIPFDEALRPVMQLVRRAKE